MRSHYTSPGARWVFTLAALIYALGATVAPVPHFAADGEELRAFAQAIATHDPASSAPEPLPPNPHETDELDCLLCQLLSSPSEPSPGPTATVDLVPVPASAPAQTAALPTGPAGPPPSARAPPRV